jgi:predicted XRE-type DNA-binding protein
MLTRRYPDSAADIEPRAVRVALAREIAQVIRVSGLNQREVAELLGTTQPKVSALMASKVDGFSLDRLVKYLNLLGEDIHIVVLPKPLERERAHTWVISPASGSWVGRWAHA